MKGVSRETPSSDAARDTILADLPDDVGRRLRVYADLLHRWQPTINLVAPSTLPDLWTRHIADSLQVQAAVPEARRWVDLGSGGGFPGLVTAVILADVSDASVHLVESDKRKAAFLKAVSRETGVAVHVHAQRIEAFVATHQAPVDAVSARALAPMPQLLTFAQTFLDRGAIGVFPKGQTADAELTHGDLAHKFVIDSRPSRLQDGSRLLIVTAAMRGGV